MSATYPGDVAARLNLARDGRFTVADGTSTLSGKYTTSRDGFEMQNAGASYVLYTTRNLWQMGAPGTLNRLAYGVDNPESVHDKVLHVDRTTLVVQAGAWRLTFKRQS